MKQKDIAVLIVVAFISAIVSLLLSKSVFTTPKDRKQEVEKIDAISETFDYPDKKYINNQSINPAQLVQIGQDTNQNPFSKPQ